MTSPISWSNAPSRWTRRERRGRRRLVRKNPTGVTAGSPGVFVPPGTNTPNDLAQLQALIPTPDPATAWTDGHHVVLGDGSHAHWNGSEWVTGWAPILLSNQQVLSVDEGVEVGTLILEDSVILTPMTPTPSVRGGQLVLGPRSSEADPEGTQTQIYATGFAARLRGNYAKGGFYVSEGTITDNHPVFIVSTTEPGAFNTIGLMIYSGFDYVLDWRDSANNIYPTPHTLVAGDFVEALIADAGDDDYYGYSRINQGEWTLDIVASAASAISVPAFISKEWSVGTLAILEYMKVGTGASSILDAGNTLGTVDADTAALIEALIGDVVSASFGPSTA